MSDSQGTEAEPPLQPKFRMNAAAALAGLALFAAAVGAHAVMRSLPDRSEQGPAVSALARAPVALDGAKLAPLRLVGAWSLDASDSRFGGVSGLALDGEELVAITDSAAVLRFPKAPGIGARVRIDELPDGPGSPSLKRNRDSEAIAADGQGRGWWVAFENVDQLWLYDRRFTRAVERRAIAGARLSDNKGVEGIAGEGGGLLLFPESGGRALSFGRGGWSEVAIAPPMRLADAIAAGDGVLVIERRVRLLGFANSLAFLRRDGASLRTAWRRRLPVAWFDNVEAIAAERIAGGYRLWLMSDDNFHPRLRTLLLIVDVPKALLEKRQAA